MARPGAGGSTAGGAIAVGTSAVPSGGGPPIRAFIVSRLAVTAWEIPDPDNIGALKWVVHDHGMEMAAEIGIKDRVRQMAVERPGSTVTTGTFPVPHGFNDALAGPPNDAGRMLAAAWDKSRAVAPRPGVRPPAGRRKDTGPAADAAVDRLVAFEQRALDALGLAADDPAAAMAEFAELRDQHKEMRAALLRAASYLDSLGTVLAGMLGAAVDPPR